MMPRVLRRVAGFRAGRGIGLARLGAIVLVAPALPLLGRADAAMPENLAQRATATASSEHNDRYLAKFAIDGSIPPPGSQAADLGRAWCVLKARSGDQAEFRLEWPEPVEISELVYFGRTSWFLNECWKNYEVYLDDAGQPVARGTFEMKHGPQRVALEKTRARRLTLRLLDSHGGPNPGAAEICVFGERPSAEDLAAWTREATRRAAGDRPDLLAALDMPEPDVVDRAKLGALIDALAELHGAAYEQAAEHRARLASLSADDARGLAALQRDVLLFDVDALLVIRRFEIEASHVYTYHYEGQRDGGGLYVVDPHRPEDAPREIVASSDGQILDADLSYDGRTVLFSWRRGAGAGYHLWTVGVDGANLRQLTDGAWHDYNGCWLPDGGIAFLSTREPQFAYCWHAPVGVLHRMNADGSGVRKLSANYLNDFTPAVLDDGRIIYTRWEYVDRPAIPIQSLWTINPDGTGLAGYFGNRVLSPGTFMEARSVPGTRKIICTMTGHNGPTRGAIGLIDRQRGVNAQAAIENLTPDTPVPRVNQGCGNTDGSKLYSGPMPLDSLRFLLSARGPILVRTMDGGCISTVLPAPGDGMQWFAAQPIRPRTRPPVVPSALPSQPEPYAVVFLQDVYNGLRPHVAPGEVKAIRVVRELHKPLRIDPSLRAFGFQFPVISCGATYAAKQVLGEAPIEDDGSACFRVPAGVPIYFMALDAQGRAVQRMRSFTHFMPGEVQGCIGCHEDRLHASVAQTASALTRPPRDLEPPEWGTEGFDYSRIVQPVLDRYCAECHAARHASGGLDLGGDKTDFFNVSYDMLARAKQGPRGTRYVNWIPTYNGQEWNILEVAPKAWGSPRSLLAEVILSNHPDETGRPRFEMDQRSRRRILAWIDLNVPYYGTSETAYPEMPGCRQLMPPQLDRTLAEVAARRCASCHEGGKIPRREWVRITNPELNDFLLAPLARAAGGTQRCGLAVFEDTDDPDYQAILSQFEPIRQMLARRPRMDMPGAVPSCDVSRSCQ